VNTCSCYYGWIGVDCSEKSPYSTTAPEVVSRPTTIKPNVTQPSGGMSANLTKLIKQTTILREYGTFL